MPELLGGNDSTGTRKPGAPKAVLAVVRSSDNDSAAALETPQPSRAAIAAKLGKIAALVRETAGGFVCAISYDTNGTSAIEFADDDAARWRPAADAVLTSLIRRTDSVTRQELTRGSPFTLFLKDHELLALTAQPALPQPASAAGCIATNEFTVRIAILAPPGASAGELKSLAELGSRAALLALAEEEKDASLGFWRRQGAETGEKYAQARAELKNRRCEEREIEAMAAKANLRRPRERFEAVGKLLAAAGSFDGWMVAVAERNRLKVVASAAGIRALPELGENSALRRSFEQQVIVVSPGARSYPSEDAAFGRPYLCVPFDSGAIALCSRGIVGESTRERILALAARIAPLMRAWVLDAELEEERVLVRRLVLRMFSAVDDERARIARDLHDDQAQLLAAAMIALQGRREEARAVFKQLEAELKRKVRELRPAALEGTTTLGDALKAEAKRLSDAGITLTLSYPASALRLSRTAQQLCYQITREALSNVLRHSGAKEVEITVERKGNSAVISIVDNGRGGASGANRRGTGLAGLKERLELMGGTLSIQSRPGSTRLIAEIPEIA